MDILLSCFYFTSLNESSSVVISRLWKLKKHTKTCTTTADTRVLWQIWPTFWCCLCGFGLVCTQWEDGVCVCMHAVILCAVMDISIVPIDHSPLWFHQYQKWLCKFWPYLLTSAPDYFCMTFQSANVCWRSLTPCFSPFWAIANLPSVYQCRLARVSKYVWGLLIVW